MKTSRIIVASFAAMSLVTVSACVTDPNTGERKISRTAIGGVGGAAAGALLGGLIGGKTGRIIGAVGGGAIGGVVGYRMDQQIKELRESTAGSGVDVTEVDDGQAILVNLPDGVTFDVGSATLKPAFRSTLNDVAASLKQYPNSLVDVYGHTDSTGSDSFNQGLSERRAQTVANYLTSQGVNSARVRWQGFGETMPVADNSTEEGRRLNRRVEIKIIPISQEEIDAAQNR
ncbi:OmpA family protein [Pelagerythrobacter rhizovicinus]|uniref:OmpA family protein n=1 Tax=Pelagerythrobacter rhizovicinus TaxID=2268576 RepID=A0A4Q2KMX6_9SPHN|nr:OmpA family protein [Pelagerythrobacter rhizovicinus]RXZ64783.1 OmpA family protein [Pelagerythrobacter rhizovicinus]